MAPDEEVGGESDPFSERKVFPEAAAVFSFRPPSLADAKGDCIIVLDTNVLLVPYTISPKNLGEIARTYSTLAQQNRLVIPAQVAREFARNRAQKLVELFQQLTTKRSTKRLQAGSYPLLESVAEYALVRELEKEIDSKLSSYEKAIDSLLATVKRWNWDDPVSLLYSDLFSPGVVLEADVDEEKLQADMVRRIAAKLPPGYKDAAKRSNAAGDLLIWHTILELGTKRQKPVLFVSGDGKPDWWHKSSGQPLYPRYELIDEFRRASGGHTFFIAQFSEFLELFGAGTEVVQEVKKEEAVSSPSFGGGSADLSASLMRAERAVGYWLRDQYPDGHVSRDRRPGGIDFVVTLPTGGRLGVDVKFFRQPHAFSANRITREMAYRAFYEIQAGGINEYLLCVVTPSPELAKEYASVLQRLVLRGPPIDVCVGYLADRAFYPTDRVATLGQTGLFSPEA